MYSEEVGLGSVVVFRSNNLKGIEFEMGIKEWVDLGGRGEEETELVSSKENDASGFTITA